MKFMTLILVIGASVAMAADQSALITKSSGGGFTAPDWVRHETCEVFADHVVITKTYGGGDSQIQLKETRDIQLTGNIQEVMHKALKEEMKQSPNNLCDGPSTMIRFNQAGTIQVLFSTGGCGSQRAERQGPNSQMLTDIVNTYCPKTFDFKNE